MFPRWMHLLDSHLSHTCHTNTGGKSAYVEFYFRIIWIFKGFSFISHCMEEYRSVWAVYK